MIDALLFGVRESVWKAGWDYDVRSCDVRDSGQPPPSMGDFFLAVHQAGAHNGMETVLDEYLAVDLTLTQRVTVPFDRIGDKMLASQLARTPGPKGQPSLNARLDALRSFLHSNWFVLQIANNKLAEWTPESSTVTLPGIEPPATAVTYGFCEPLRYIQAELPRLEGGSWFFADAEAEMVGLIGVLHFDRCRRLQGLGVYL